MKQENRDNINHIERLIGELQKDLSRKIGDMLSENYEDIYNIAMEMYNDDIVWTTERMQRKNRKLGNKRPISVLQEESGREKVKYVLECRI